VRRRSQGPAPNHFLTVIDAYRNTPLVQSVQLIGMDPLRIEVTTAGRIDEIILPTPSTPSRDTAHRPLGVVARVKLGDQATKQVQVGEVGGAGPGYAQARISGVDYEANEVVLTAAAQKAAEFTPGRYVRIYNEGRSAMYRILRTQPAGAHLRLSLDSSALVAQGPVVKTGEGVVWLQAFLTFANGRSDQAGELVPGRPDYFAGSYLSDGQTVRRLRGTVRDEVSKVYLADPVTGAELARDYAGKLVSIWQYGVGDSIELPRVR